jgi:GntR family transcriptional regulator
VSSLAEAPPLPRYQQVRAALRSRIESGEWQVGQQIPTEIELVERFGVSRGTLRQAVDALVREGLLKRMQGLGTFVRRPPVAAGFGSFLHFQEDLRNRGFSVDVRLIETRVIPAEPDVAAWLDLPEETPLLLIRRLVLLDGEPFRLEDYYAAHGRFAGLLDEELERIPLTELIKQRYGIHLTKLQKWLEPALVQGEEARLLDLPPGDPVLRIEVLAWGSDTHHATSGRDVGVDGSEPIDFRRIYMRADKCRFFVEVEQP